MFFVSCIIHILHTGCAKIKKKIPAPKVKQMQLVDGDGFGIKCHDQPTRARQM
jgi:hypothetical protein